MTLVENYSHIRYMEAWQFIVKFRLNQRCGIHFEGTTCPKLSSNILSGVSFTCCKTVKLFKFFKQFWIKNVVWGVSGIIIRCHPFSHIVMKCQSELFPSSLVDITLVVLRYLHKIYWGTRLLPFSKIIKPQMALSTVILCANFFNLILGLVIALYNFFT